MDLNGFVFSVILFTSASVFAFPEITFIFQKTSDVLLQWIQGPRNYIFLCLYIYWVLLPFAWSGDLLNLSFLFNTVKTRRFQGLEVIATVNARNQAKRNRT